jgi:hypothetical protein
VPLLSLALTFLLFAASLWRPPVAVAALVLMISLEMLLQANFSVFQNRQELFNLMTGALLLAAVVRRHLRREPLLEGLGGTVVIAALAFYAWGYASMAWSPTSGAFLSETFSALPYWVLFLLVAPMLIARLEEFSQFAWALLIFGGAMAVLILLNPNFTLVSGRLGIDLGHGNRGNPLALGTVGGLIMLAAALLPSASLSIWMLATRIGGFLAGAGLVLLSGSRGQMLAAAAVAVLCLPIAYAFRNGRGVALTIVGGLVLSGGLYFAASRFVTQENIRRWDAHSLTTGGAGRLENASDLLEHWLRHPESWVAGLGHLAFESIPTNRSGDPYTHVLLADAIGEGGLIGATLLLVALAAAAANAFQLHRLSRDDPRSRAVVGLLVAMLLYMFLLSNKQGSMLGVPMLFLLMMMVGRLWRIHLREAIEWEHSWLAQEVADSAEEMGDPVAPMGVGPMDHR